MASSNFETPTRRNKEAESHKSLLFAAHANTYEKNRRSKFQSLLANTYTTLPNFSPKPHAKDVVAVNPFVDGLERLGQPFCSPDVFTHVISPGEQSKLGFHWTIDDIAMINPAPIESPDVQDSGLLHEEEESKAQEAISSFFETQYNILSPIGAEDHKELPRTPEGPQPGLMSHMSTPCFRKERSRMSQEASVQTSLSLPPELPPELEQMLQAYHLTEEPKDDNVGNLSNSSLRRQLFFSEGEQLSPVRRPVFESPVLVGQKCKRFSRSDWTPDQGSRSLPSSPDCSPVLSRTDSVPALDFTGDMAVDCSSQQLCMDLSMRTVVDPMEAEELRTPTKSRSVTQDTGYQTLDQTTPVKANSSRIFNSTTVSLAASYN